MMPFFALPFRGCVFGNSFLSPSSLWLWLFVHQLNLLRKDLISFHLNLNQSAAIWLIG
jgi:hypothetical protein